VLYGPAEDSRSDQRHFRILVLDRIFIVLPAEIPGFMLPKGLEEGFMRIRPNTVRQTATQKFCSIVEEAEPGQMVYTSETVPYPTPK
jgi:hypothetical protein